MQIWRFEFPPGTRVNDGLNMAFHVWGDGKPNLSFRTGKEMNNWILEQDQKARTTGSHRRPFPLEWILAFSGSSLLLIVLILARSRIIPRIKSARA